MAISGFHSIRNGKQPNSRTPVCILGLAEARDAGEIDVTFKCHVRIHKHLPRFRVDELISRGILTWVGKHKKRATYIETKSWEKVYKRSPSGAASFCLMELTPAGCLLGKPAKPKTNISHARNGKVVEIAVELGA